MTAAKKKKMTEEEVAKRSTRAERHALARYKGVQERARLNDGIIGETDLLILSEAVGILVARNQRLGLIK